MGVISLERKEVSVEDVELGDEDYEGENEDIIRVDPSQMKVEPAAEEWFISNDHFNQVGWESELYELVREKQA